MQSRPSPIEYLLVFVAFWSIYLVTASDAGWHNDGIIRLYVAQNLLEHGDPILRQAEDGTLDGTWVVTGRGGRPFSFYGVGHSLTILPAAWLTEQIGDLPYIWDDERFFLGMVAPVAAALLVTATYSAARALGCERRPALVTAAAIGLATHIWPHSRDLHDNLIEAAFIGVSLAGALWARQSEKPWPALLAGGAFGFAFVTRSSAALALPAVLMVMFADDVLARRIDRAVITRAAAFALGAAALGWLWPAYNWARFGDVLTTGYEQMFARGLPLPGQPILPGIAGWLVSPWHGLLIYVPLVWLFPWAARRLWPGERWLVVGGVLTLAAYVLFYAGFRNLGHWSYGPGYLLPAIPWLVLPLAALFAAWPRLSTPQRAGLTAVCALSLIVQLPGVLLPIVRVHLQSAGQFTGNVNRWFSLEWSPIRVLGRDGIRAVGNVLRRTPFELVPGTDNLLTTYVGLNAPEWWWVAVFYRGFEPVLLVPLVLLGVSVGAVILLLRLGD